MVIKRATLLQTKNGQGGPFIHFGDLLGQQDLFYKSVLKPKFYSCLNSRNCIKKGGPYLGNVAHTVITIIIIKFIIIIIIIIIFITLIIRIFYHYPSSDSSYD